MAIDKHDVEDCVDYALEVLGNDIRIATPLGLGKPNQLLNAFYQRAVTNSDIQLQIFTALSLERPKAGSELEAKFLDPFTQRLFGDYESLDYVAAQRQGDLPDNITVSEFYIKAGSMKGITAVQSHYISTNYTFVARDIASRGANLLLQLVSEKIVDGRSSLSLSCNTDVTLDLLPLMRANNGPVLAMAQVHDELPFMQNKAVVDKATFDLVVRNKQYNTTLFSTPNTAVPDADHIIGLRASALIRDGGTLQIGIGSLGDAITYSCLLRHADNKRYQELLDDFPQEPPLSRSIGDTGVFKKGLYGCSEMFVNGFVHLLKAGILKRKVYADLGVQSLLSAGKIADDLDSNALQTFVDSGLVNAELTAADRSYLERWGVLCDGSPGKRLKGGVVLHGGFFLGPRDFYAALNALSDEQHSEICMDSVRHINRISDAKLQSLQRKDARFINTAMMVTLSGAVVSDGLENGQVISGVGGQYNFVAQAHELADARSVICVRSTRTQGNSVQSNIVENYGHTTIPRHLRDIVITEYGVADLRGKTDAEVIKALLAVSDARFQNELLSAAKTNGKVELDYQLPDALLNNTPAFLQAKINKWQSQSLFPQFPLGSDFTDEEVALSNSLRELKKDLGRPGELLKTSIRALLHDADDEIAAPYLERIGLAHPDTPKELLMQQLLLLELEDQGYLKPL